MITHRIIFYTDLDSSIDKTTKNLSNALKYLRFVTRAKYRVQTSISFQ